MKSIRSFVRAATAALPLFLGCSLFGADSLPTAAMAQRLDTALQTYREQSARIADEKIPLVREINRLEDENITLRDKITAALSSTADSNRSFDALRNRVEEFKAQTDFAARFLQEYMDSFESRIHVAEDQHYKDRLTEIRKSLEDEAEPLSARFTKQLEALALGLERNETVFGGYEFDGKAITPAGVVESGKIKILGPAAYFKGASGTTGLLKFHTGTVEPAVVTLAGPAADRLGEFITSGAGPVPLDASMGNAILINTANVRIIDHIRQGGPVGYAILMLGGIAAILSLIKLLDIVRFRSVDSRDIGDIVRTAQSEGEEAALGTVRKYRGPIGEMLELGVRNIRANSVLLEEMMLSVILRKRPEIERYLPFLAITAAAAPLLGLLGTVVGMIRTFGLITVFGTGDPRALSGGISEALVTTELGLMVAIPTLVLHGVFSRMIKGRFGDMERVAFEFVKTISLEESKTAPAPKK